MCLSILFDWCDVLESEYTLGPIIGHYLGLPNGGQTVMTAMAGTAVIFLGLSGYALITRKDFSFMGGFLAVGILVAIFNLFTSLLQLLGFANSSD